MLWVVIVLVLVAADRLTKYIIVQNIENGASINVINNFFYLTNHENYGAAWGIFKNGRYFFIVLTIMASVFLIVLIINQNNILLRTSLTILLGGALGNLIDRIVKGGVTDFLDFYIGKYHLPTSNVSDMCILAGTILLMIYMFTIYKEPEKKNE